MKVDVKLQGGFWTEKFEVEKYIDKLTSILVIEIDCNWWLYLPGLNNNDLHRFPPAVHEKSDPGPVQEHDDVPAGANLTYSYIISSIGPWFTH